MSKLAKFESRILETSDRAPAQCRTIMLPTIRTYVEFRHFEELISNLSGSISLKLMEVKKPLLFKNVKQRQSPNLQTGLCEKMCGHIYSDCFLE